MWPQFDFSLARDLNGDGDMNDRYVLTGDECIVFFLGGPGTIINTAAAPLPLPVADGFAKNPRNPFAAGGSRVGPFAEFRPERLFDFESSVSGGIDDGVLSYEHAFPAATRAPYMFFSSYEGQGYRPATDGDINNNGTVDPPLEMANVYLQRADDTSTATVDEVGRLEAEQLPDHLGGHGRHLRHRRLLDG